METKFNVNEQDFFVVFGSERLEGYNPDTTNVVASRNFMPEITKDVVINFLNCPETKVCTKKARSGEIVLVASNDIAKESIIIKGLGDHYCTYIKALARAEQYRKLAKDEPGLPLLSKKFVEYINGGIQSARYRSGEVGIGHVRKKDRMGRPVEVSLAEEQDGILKKTDVELESSRNKNVVKKLKELIAWTNDTIPIANSINELLLYIAEFHARFIKIHPFRDGNGRTARLLSNYLMRAKSNKLIYIPEEKRFQYIIALDYAIRTSDEKFVAQGPEYKEFLNKVKEIKPTKEEVGKERYLPLKKFFEKCLIENSNEYSQFIGSILDKNGNNPFLKGTQIEY